MSPPKHAAETQADDRLPAAADPRLPLTGSLLSRPYKGGVVQVRVLDQGFEFDGTVYPSLSAVAKTVTGSHCNGFHFFRLNNRSA